MRFRKLRIAWSVTCAIACVLLIVLWVRSNQITDRLHGRLWRSEAFLLSAKEGRIVTVVFTWNTTRSRWQWETKSQPVDDELSFPVGSMDQYASHFGFGWINRPTYIVDRSRELLDRIDSGPLVTEFIIKASVNSGFIPTKSTSRLNGAGPLVPIWFLVVLTSAFATLPWIQWKWRFSLRTLLIITTLAAVALGLAVMKLRGS